MDGKSMMKGTLIDVLNGILARRGPAGFTVIGLSDDYKVAKLSYVSGGRLIGVVAVQVSAFLKRKGLDPAEFKAEVTGAAGAKFLKLSRKQKRRIEAIANAGSRVLVHLNTRRTGYVVRDQEHKFYFEKRGARRGKGFTVPSKPSANGHKREAAV